MADPPVYLIDEPTAGIEPRTSEEIYDLIQSLARVSGKAILLVDQDIKSAIAIADYVYVVKNGSVVGHGSHDSFGGDTDALVARWLYAGSH
jgi:branched-chain amino acid transport system ATP-binding protein